MSTTDFLCANIDLLHERDLIVLRELAFASLPCLAFTPPSLRICLVTDPATCLERIATEAAWWRSTSPLTT